MHQLLITGARSQNKPCKDWYIIQYKIFQKRIFNIKFKSSLWQACSSCPLRKTFTDRCNFLEFLMRHTMDYSCNKKAENIFAKTVKSFSLINLFCLHSLFITCYWAAFLTTAGIWSMCLWVNPSREQKHHHVIYLISQNTTLS